MIFVCFVRRSLPSFRRYFCFHTRVHRVHHMCQKQSDQFIRFHTKLAIKTDGHTPGHSIYGAMHVLVVQWALSFSGSLSSDYSVIILSFVVMSYDQLWAASPTGRNAVTWRWSLSNDQRVTVAVYHYNDREGLHFFYKTSCIEKNTQI